MLTEDSVIAAITVLATGHLEVRRDDCVLRDGEIISRSPHRWVLAPGDALDNQPPEVVAAATAAWTPEKVAAWTDSFVTTQAAERAKRDDAVAQLQAVEQLIVDRETELKARMQAANDLLAQQQAREEELAQRSADLNVQSRAVDALAQSLAGQEADQQTRVDAIAQREAELAAKTSSLDSLAEQLTLREANAI